MRTPTFRCLAWPLVLALALVPALRAQTATLVKDIEPLQYPGSSQPEQMYSVGRNVFFAASGNNSGLELWVTDGTPLGTEQLSDVCPESCDSRPVPLGAVGGTLFWAASSGPNWQLWRSDSTRAGTFALKPTGSGVGIGSLPSSGEITFALSDRLLFFAGCTQESGCELWASDGTHAGTRKVKELGPGPGDAFLSLRAAGNKIYFASRDFTSQNPTIGTTDGTEAGTVTLRDLGPGEVKNLTTAGGRLFFTLQNESAGTELWTSDGTSAGTVALTHFSKPQPFFGVFGQPWLKASGRRVYFVADDSIHGAELWRSDGTLAGTQRLTNFDFAAPFINPYDLSFVEEIGGRALFMATDGVTSRRLWTSQGTLASLTALPDPCGGACEFLDGDARLTRSGDRAFFAASDGAHGRELWTSDGTASGTKMVRDACPGTCGGISVLETAPANPGPVLFVAPDGSRRSQLWSSDGTAAGTRRLSDFRQADGYLFLEPGKRSVAVSGGKVYFTAVDSHDLEIWVSEGGATAHLLADISRNGVPSSPASLVAFQGRLAFVAQQVEAPRTLWLSDGSSAGTAPLLPDPPFQSGNLSHLTPVGDRIALLVNASGVGRPELWSTDGTPAGTVRLVSQEHLSALTPFRGALNFTTFNVDAVPFWQFWRSDLTPAGTAPILTFPDELGVEDLKVLGDEMYLLLRPPTGDRQLWKSDGTAAGTLKLASISTPVYQETLEIARLGSRASFLIDGGLWSTDGTPGGTAQLTPNPTVRAGNLVALNGALYYFRLGDDPELWRSDGSAAGTARLAAFPNSSFFDDDGNAAHLSVAGGRLYFAIGDRDHGIELWSSDGTFAGTVLVRDLLPGPDSSRPSQLREAGGRLFFSAFDGTHGRELWQTDGSAAGTRLVQDIAPQQASSGPYELTVVGDRLYFAADDGIAGRELWTLPLASTGCQASPAYLCLGGASGHRYRVEAVWRDPNGVSGTGTALPLTADTGTFWFFSPSNIEVVVKVLDGQGVNGHVWVFYGALSDVQYDLTVTDTETGLTRRYSNLQGRLASVGDTQAFGPLGAKAAPDAVTAAQIAPGSPPAQVETWQGAVASAPCSPGAQRLCLNQGRFALEVVWKDFQGHTGQGTAVPLTGDTGTFWFFNAANLELVVKALDGQPVNGHFWIFYGALSNVEYTLTVRDTQTGTVRTYKNPSGRFASVADTQAF